MGGANVGKKGKERNVGLSTVSRDLVPLQTEKDKIREERRRQWEREREEKRHRRCGGHSLIINIIN